jgi:hypothetical protein
MKIPRAIIRRSSHAVAPLPSPRPSGRHRMARTLGRRSIPVMKIAAAALALVLVGCASSGKIEYGANAHLARAQQLEAVGDQEGAARERAAADKQFAKARVRAYDEARWGF